MINKWINLKFEKEQDIYIFSTSSLLPEILINYKGEKNNLQ